MDFILEMLNLQFTLFALIVIGIITRRVGIITDDNRRSFSALLIKVVLPCNIVASFMGGIEVSGPFLYSCALAVVISLAVQLVASYGSPVLFRSFPAAKRSVMSYGMICSNSSFIGLPIAEALYGPMGVLYTSIFQIPIRVTMWTAGLALFTRVDRREAYRMLLVHPCIIAVWLGFIVMLLPFDLPYFLTNTITSVSRCTVPLSMFVVGAILADADIRTLITRDTLYFTAWRLVIYPLLVLGILRALPLGDLDPLVISIAVIMSAMPAGSTTSILADQYGCDALYASQIIFISTLASIFTIPALGLLL